MPTSRRARVAVVLAVVLVVGLALGGVLTLTGRSPDAEPRAATSSTTSTEPAESARPSETTSTEPAESARPSETTSTEPAESARPSETTSTEPTESARPSDEPSPVEATTTLVATAVVDEVAVRADPDETIDPDVVLDRREETSGELVFVVDEQQPEWLLVQLPVRPNGSTGWIRAADVSLSQHEFAIAIDITAHELVLRDGTEVVLTAPVGVGTQDTPTPGGRYYVKELLQPPSPDGVYGVYAYGLSGFSNVLTSFAGGDGVIGIHGTNAPELVGTDVSSGCLRLTNDVITRMVEDVGLPLGTPVSISA